MSHHGQESPRRARRRRAIRRSDNPARDAAALSRFEMLEPRLLLSSMYVDHVAAYDPATQYAGDWYVTDVTQGADPNALDAGDEVVFRKDVAGAEVPGLVWGTDAFGGIQTAIDAAAPGDTVNIGPGAYQPSLASWKELEITKSLSLVGAGSGQTTVELSEGVMNGVEIRGSDLDVTLEGLTFTREDGGTYAANFPLRVAETSSSFTNLTLRDVEVSHAQASNVFLGGNGAFDSITVEDSSFHHGGTWGFLCSGDVSAITVIDSHFDHNGQADAAHGVGFDLTGTSTNVHVSGGTFSNNTAKGINLMRVSDALFDGVTADDNIGQPGAGFGVSLWEWGGDSGNLTFRNVSAGGNGLDGLLIGTEAGCSVTGVTVEGGLFDGNLRNGIRADSAWAGGTITGVSIHDSSFTGQAEHLATPGLAPVDASGNWWGSADEAAVAASITGLVDFTPYLASGTDTDPAAPGFQGDFSELHVTALGEQTGPLGRIMEGIDLVDGSTVHVGPGTYSERLTITSPVELLGPQAGVDPTQAGARTDPSAEAIITEQGLSTPNPDVLIEVGSGAAGTVIDGFTLEGDPVNATADTSVLRIWSDATAVRNNFIDGRVGVLYKGGDALSVEQNAFAVNKTGLIAQPNPSTNLTIAGNAFALGASPAGDESAIYATSVDGLDVVGNSASGFLNAKAVAGSNLTNVSVRENVFDGNRDAVSFWGDTTFVEIADNELTDSLRYGISIKGADLTISGNVISGSGEAGINVDRHVIDTERVTVFGNSITGSGVVELQASGTVSETVDASGNWWGSADEAAVAASITGSVDFTPYLASGTDTDPAAPGFQGDFSELHVTALGEQTGPLGRIMEGIDLVDGSTVHVAAGTYDETVTFAGAAAKDNVSILGDPADRPHVTGGVLFDNDADITSISLANLRLTGDANPSTTREAVVYFSNGGGVYDLALDNLLIDGENVSGRNGLVGNRIGGDLSVTGTEFRNVLGWSVADFDASTSAPYGRNELPLTSVVFANNTVVDSNGTVALRGNDVQRTPTVEVYGNTFQTIGGNQGEQGLQWAAIEINHAESLSMYDNLVDGVAEGEYGEGQAVQLWDIGDVDIDGNVFANSHQGVFVYGGSAGGAFGGPYAVPTGTVRHNTFSGNAQYNLSVESTNTGGPLDASLNWWGTTDPSAAGVLGNVDYTPMLASGGLAPGFAPDLSQLHVHALGAQTGTVGRVREGVNLVDGSTVHVGPGTYNETVVIDKSLDLIGAGASATLLDGTGLGGEAVVIAADDVTVQGFEIAGYSSAGAAVITQYDADSYTDVHVLDNVIHDIAGGHGFGIYMGYQAEAFFPENGPLLTEHIDYSGLVISGNEIYNTANAGIVLQSITASTGVLEVSGNDVHDAGASGVWIDTARTIELDGNHIHDNALAGVFISGFGDGYYEGTPDGPLDPKDIDVTGNVIEGNGSAAVVLWDGWTDAVHVNRNHLLDNAAVQVENHLPGTLDAEYNWWGTGDGAAIDAMTSGDVDYTPWLDLDTDLIVVDDDWAALADGEEVQVGDVIYQIGLNAFDTVDEGVAAVDAGGEVSVLAGSYVNTAQVVVDRDMDVAGAGSADVTIAPGFSTGSSGDSRGWWLVDPGVTFNLSGVTLDGAGQNVYQGIRAYGSGTIDDVAFRNVTYGTYLGMAVAAMGGDVDIVNSTFENIGRLGVIYFGAGTTGDFANNVYTGKGAVDGLDYAVEVGAGAVVNITGNTITDNLAQASSDGSVSAGVLVTTYFGGGSTAHLSGNDISSNTIGVAVGYDETDASVVTLDGDVLTGNDTGVSVIGGSVDLLNVSATGNTTGLEVDANATATVDGGAFDANTRGIEVDGGTLGLSGASVSDNADVGVKAEGGSVTIAGAVIADNGDNGLLAYASDQVTVSDTTFSGNSAAQPAEHGHGDVTLYDFDGDATLTNVVIDSSNNDYGLQIRGPHDPATEAPLGASGVITLDNVELTGTAGRYGFLLQSYLDTDLTFTDVTVDAGEMGGLVMFDVAGTPIDLGNTTFHDVGANAYLAVSLADADATDATFLDTADAPLDVAVVDDSFAIEDRVYHAVDATDYRYGAGFVTWNAGHAYVTADSFIPPFSSAPSIQRAVNAADAGWTIHVAPGTYDSQYFNETPPHYSENDKYAPALILYKDGQTIQAHDGSGAAGDGVDDVVIQSTHSVWSNSVAVQRATGGLWDGSQYVGAGVYPAGGTAPNAVTLVANDVTVDGFTIHRPSLSANLHDDYFNTAGVMVGELFAGSTQYGSAGGVGGNTISNNHFSDVWHGVIVLDSADNVIRNNVIEATPTNHWAGLGIGGKDSVDAVSPSTGNQVLDNTINAGISVGTWLAATIDNSGTIVQGNEATRLFVTYSDSADFEVRDNVFTDGLEFDANGTLSNVAITGNDVTGAGNGISVNNAVGGLISANTVHDVPYNGIAVLDTTGLTVSDNTVSDSGVSGIILLRTADSTISNNTLTGGANYLGGEDFGALALYVDNSNITVSGNDITANAGAGVYVRPGGAVAHSFDSNVITGNVGPGVVVDGDAAMLQSNDLTGNEVGVRVLNGATADLGGGALGSAGGNLLTSYSGVGGSYAVENLNAVADGDPDVQAENNTWGSTLPVLIEQVVYDDTDDPALTQVIFTNPQGATASTVWVDDDWAGTPLGDDPDGTGPATAYGYDAFHTVADGLTAVADAGDVIVHAGTYNETAVIDRSLDLLAFTGETPALDGTGMPGLFAVDVSGASTSAGIAGFALQNWVTGGVSVTDADVAVDGLTIAGGAVGVRVDGGSADVSETTITGTGSFGGLYVLAGGQATLSDSTLDGSGNGGVTVFNGSVDVERSIVTNTNAGLTLLSGSASIHNSDLSGNGGAGVVNYTAGVVDASGNWWGSADEATVQAATSGPVDFTPYLGSGANAHAGAGFDGDFSDLYVSRSGEQSGTTGRIQEGVDLADPAGADPTVHVLAGTYTAVDRALAVIDKDITLSGSGQDAVTGTVLEGGAYGAGTDTTGLGTSWPRAIVVQSDGVTVEDLRIQNFMGADPAGWSPGGYGIVARAQGSWGVSDPTLDNVTVRDVAVQDALIGIRAQDTNDLLIEGTDYFLTSPAGGGSGGYAHYLTGTASQGSTGTTLRGNTMSDGGIWMTATSGAMIGGPNPGDGNVVTDANYNGIWLGQQFAAGTGSSGVIQGNTVDGAFEGGIAVWNVAGEPTAGIEILDNAVYDVQGNWDGHGGISLWSVDDTPVTVSGNVSDGAGAAGLTVRQSDLSAGATISDNELTGSAGDGIFLRNDVSGTLAVTDNTITGNADGLTTMDASLITLTGNDFASNAHQNIQWLRSGRVDAADNTFDGIDPATATLAEHFAIEDTVTHQPDNASYGLVLWNSGHLYVTAPGTGPVDETIQRAIDAADDGWTVHVQAGVHDETLDIDGRSGLSVVGEDRDTTFIRPTGTLGWDVGGYGASRQAVARVVDSTDITLEGLRLDLQSVAGNNVFGIFYWDSTGVVHDDVVENNQLPDASGGYYEHGAYLRAPGYTHAGRAAVTVSDSVFADVGRVAINVHDYVDVTITGNEFYKTVADFGYAIELGSESIGQITGNTIHGFDTPAASDGSASGGIYVENCFTYDVAAPGFAKTVTVSDNEIYNSQFGLGVGNEWDGFAGSVGIELTATGNYIHDNTGAGVRVADEDASAGSYVHAAFSGNRVLNNGVGYAFSTDGDGELVATLTHEFITGNDLGVTLDDYAADPTASTYDIAVHDSDLSGNATAAVQNNYAGTTIDASGNWWGENDETLVQAETTGLVDFTPYLHVGTDTDGDVTNGFQGDFSELWATTLGEQVGGQRVQEGVDLAEAGGTLHLNDGTYLASNTSVDKALTIVGQSQAGTIVAPEAEDDNLDSTWGGAYQHGFIVRSSDVTIRDLTVDGQGNVALTPGRNNFRMGVVTDGDAGEFDNLTVDATALRHIYRRGIQVYYTAPLTDGHVITDNVIDDVELQHGIYLIGGDGIISGNEVSNVGGRGIGAAYGSVEIRANVVDTAGWSGIYNFNYGQPGETVTIAGNTVTNVDTGLNLVGLTDSTVVGGPAGDGNLIDLTGSAGAGIGILSWWNVGQPLIQGNEVLATGPDSGAWIFHNEDPAEAPIFRDNVFTATASDGTNPGEGVGVFMTDDGDFLGDEPGWTYAELYGNTIDGFARGIDLVQNAVSPAGGRDVAAIIGTADPADANVITGAEVGIRVYESDPSGARAAATIGVNHVGMGGAGNDVGLLVDGGTAAVTGALFTDNPTGAVVRSAGVLDVSGSAFAGSDVGIHADGNPVSVSTTSIDGGSTGLRIDGGGDATVNGLTATGATTGIDVADGNATIHAADVSGAVTGVAVAATGSAVVTDSVLTGNDVGVDVNGGTAMVQGSDLNSNATAGLFIQGGAIVDAGQAGSSVTDYTGLGASTGGNDFTGYLPGPGAAMAIYNANSNVPNNAAGPQGYPHDVAAEGNAFHPSFGGYPSQIEQVVLHDGDFLFFGYVDFAQPAIGNSDLSYAPEPMNPGAAVTLNGQFEGDDEAHTVTVAWGEGEADTVLNLPAGTFTFSAPHTYAAPVTYTATVTVSTADGDADDAEVDIVGNTPPTVTSMTRNADDLPSEMTELNFAFSEDVAASISVDDLAIYDDATGNPVSLAGASVSYDSATHTATWDLSSAAIDAGYYTIRLSAAGISDADAGHLDGNGDGVGGDDYVRAATYVAIPGDANLDGDVDVFEFGGMGDAQILGANIGTTSGATWAMGDFNGDGDVDVFEVGGAGDAQILAANLGRSVQDVAADVAVVSGDAPADELSEESPSAQQHPTEDLAESSLLADSPTGESPAPQESPAPVVSADVGVLAPELSPTALPLHAMPDASMGLGATPVDAVIAETAGAGRRPFANDHLLADTPAMQDVLAATDRTPERLRNGYWFPQAASLTTAPATDATDNDAADFDSVDMLAAVPGYRVTALAENADGERQGRSEFAGPLDQAFLRARRDVVRRDHPRTLDIHDILTEEIDLRSI